MDEHIIKSNFYMDVVVLSREKAERLSCTDYSSDKVNTLCVQCEMGISRSAGIAAGILKASEKDASVILNDTRCYPNLLCYEKTVNVFKMQNKETSSTSI